MPPFAFPFIALAGFMGTGKSTVGRILAEKLGWTFVDSDEKIAELAGPIPRIFSEQGEEYFRRLEREVLAALSQRKNFVLATGGGSVLLEENRNALARGLTIVLEAPLPTIVERLKGNQERPLAAKLDELYPERQPIYDSFPLRLSTEGLNPEEIADALLALLSDEPRKIRVSLKERSYPICIEAGGIYRLGDFVSERCPSARCLLVSDENVFSLYGKISVQSLQKAGIEVVAATVPPGETSKSFECAETLFRRLIESRSDRRSPIIALGGGVVGDLAGFVASTYQRGVPLIQVPTSLLAQIDSSVGGKVAINHPLGKNLIGAFHQPQGVLIDPLCLHSLSEREYRSGLAELIKYGVILDADFFGSLENNLTDILARRSKILISSIARACELKAGVVAMDEREENLRAILNFGHTLGHAVEKVAGYGVFTHGEAVAIGMAKAGELAESLAGFRAQDQRRLIGLLEAVGLPTEVPALPIEALLEAMELDKKNQCGQIAMVLPVALGRVELPRSIETEALGKILGF